MRNKTQSVICVIRYKYKNVVYVGETSRLFKMRKKEQENKVRLIDKDEKNFGRMRAAKRTNGKIRWRFDETQCRL